MERLICYAYRPEAWFTMDADDGRETRNTHVIVLAGSAVTNNHGECRIPLYGHDSDRLPRFFPPTGSPTGYWANAFLLFSKILHVTATPGRLLTFPPTTPTLDPLRGGVMIGTRVEVTGLSSLSLESDEEAISRDPGAEESVVVSPTLPECYYPTLIFESRCYDGLHAPNIEFSWRLKDEMILVMKRTKVYWKAPAEKTAPLKA